MVFQWITIKTFSILCEHFWMIRHNVSLIIISISISINGHFMQMGTKLLPRYYKDVPIFKNGPMSLSCPKVLAQTDREIRMKIIHYLSACTGGNRMFQFRLLYTFLLPTGLPCIQHFSWQISLRLMNWPTGVKSCSIISGQVRVPKLIYGVRIRLHWPLSDSASISSHN